MEFCPVCDNLFYLKINDKVLFHECKKCGNEKEITKSTSIFKQNFTKTNQQFEASVNKYTKLDPTLPRIYTMQCPSTTCVNHTIDRPEIIYVRYNNIDLKYVYLCPLCDSIWKSNKIEI